MKCTFCLEELNEGASVCKVCARQQPASAEDVLKKRQRLAAWVALAVLIVTVGGVSTWLVTDSWERTNAVNKIADCLRSKGDTTATTDWVNFEVDDAMKQTGKGWRDSLMMAAMFTAKNFSPEQGACYIDSDNIISEMKGR